MIIIGLGTGRCGSQTLAKMFGFTHCKYNYHDLRSDVCPHYIDYIDYINNKTDVKFVCLKRDKKETIDSFVRNNLLSKEKASNYYDEYYRIAEMFANKMTNFKIFDTEELNNPMDIEDFIGIKSVPQKRIISICKFSKSLKDEI